MFVRCKKPKDGKEHRYWSVVENVRVRGGRVVQRQVLYLGEINDSQRAAWCRSIKVMEGKSRSRQMALFPEDREAPALNCEINVGRPLLEPRRGDRRHGRALTAASALRDLLGSDRAIADDTLYRCLDRLLAHKQEFFSFLRDPGGRRCSTRASTCCCTT